MDRFVHGATFNAGRYFGTERQALVCGSFSVSLSSSILNLFWNLECSEYKGVFEYWGVLRMYSLFPYLNMFSNDFQWGPVSCSDQ